MTQESALRSWSRTQAGSMLMGLGVCVWHGVAWPLAALSALSFARLIRSQRGAFTPHSRFGAANAVTTVRLLLVLGLSAPPRLLTTSGFVTIVIGVFVLDGVDGWLARRSGDASAFGAHFDMETDAFFVLVLTLRLWLTTGGAAWLLIPGVLRYVYVLWLWIWPGTGREAPRSRFGRAAFALLVVGLAAGLVLPGKWGRLAVLVGTLSVSSSFARSFYYSRLRV